MTCALRRSTALRCVVVALALAGANAGAATSSADSCDVVLFDAEVEDQFEDDRSTSALAGTIAVVVWGDRRASDWAASWSDLLASGLRGQIEGGLVQVRRWAHTRGAPFFVKGRIRDSFPERRSAWAYLDWDGVWKERYAPREDHVTVYVFDRAGCLVARETGTAVDAAAVARVVRAAQEILIRDHEAATGEAPRTGEIHR